MSNCDSCANYAPKPEPWIPRVGDKVWWDGVRLIETGAVHAKSYPAGVYALTRTPESSTTKWKVPYKLKEVDAWTTIDHIRSASEAPKPVKPLHYDGEPCELPVWVGDRERAEGLTFVHEGHKGSPEGRWFVTTEGDMIMFGSIKAANGEYRWLLRPVKKGPKITVHVFEESGEHEYSFYGEPDWKRIERETIGNGALAIIVSGITENVDGERELSCDAVRIVHKDILDGSWVLKRNNKYRGLYILSSDIPTQIYRIKSAIAAWKKAKEPQWKVGEWAWLDFQDLHEPAQIVGVGSNNTYLVKAMRFTPGSSAVVSLPNLRPLTAKDWTRTIDGVAFRAYRTKNGSVIITAKTQSGGQYTFIAGVVYLALINHAGIPIMPYTADQGDMPYPEKPTS